MSEAENEGQQQEQPPANEGQQQEQAPPQPQPQPSWTGPSQQEWQQTQAVLQRMASFFEPDEEPQEYDPDLPVEIQRYVQELTGKAIQPYAPAIQAAQQERGTRVMNEIFDAVEEEVGGKFDRKLAERIAHGYAVEGLDPVQATAAAAREAHRLKVEYGKEELEAYKARLKRGLGQDPDASGSAEPARKPFKTKDEVIEHWASKFDV